MYLCNLFGDNLQQDPLPLGPEERRFCIFSLAFSSDGREILGGANDGFLYVYDRECNQRALRVISVYVTELQSNHFSIQLC